MSPRALRSAIAALFLLAAVALVGSVPILAAGTRARFVSPDLERPVFGKTAIEVAVETAPGIRTLKVEVFLDGRPTATLLDPPYRTPWDAGEGIEAHTIRARVYTSDGDVTTIEGTTSPRMGVVRARVLLVEVYATVKDEAKHFVRDLDQSSFVIFEDGVPQKIALFTEERKPVQVILLLDVSASMGKEERLTRAIEAARLFVEALEPKDRVAVVTFSDGVQVLQPFTDDRQGVLDVISRLTPQRGTALYDAIFSASQLLGAEEGRKALVLLSDGQDLAYDGMGPGSARTLEQSIEEALRQQVTAFTIGLGNNLSGDFDFNHTHSAEEVLSRLASDTGGRFVPVARPGRLRNAFENVLEEMRYQYTLGYVPANDRRDGSWRSIEVGVNRRHAVVSARKGYFAPTE